MRYYSRIIKHYKPGEIIFTENSVCDGMFIIDSGHVRVYKTVGDGQNKREIDLCALGPKAMFGEMAMIDENKRSASVQALEPTVCTVITKKVFEDQLKMIPSWMVNMIKILVLRLRETNEKLRSIVEHYTPPPPDAGSVITVDEDKTAPSSAADEEEQCTESSTLKKGKHYQSDEIVKDLFGSTISTTGGGHK